MNHDQSYKLLFSHAEMVADLLRGFVHEDWVQQWDFTSLEEDNPREPRTSGIHAGLNNEIVPAKEGRPMQTSRLALTNHGRALGPVDALVRRAARWP